MAGTPSCPLCGKSDGVCSSTTSGAYNCTHCNRLFRPSRERRASPGRTTRDRSSRQERHNARQVGGRCTANSGAGRDKGDVKVPGLLREEDKTTLKASYVLKLEDLRKVASAARGDEIPIMRISFEDNLRQQFVVLPNDWFQRLLAAYREEDR